MKISEIMSPKVVKCLKRDNLESVSLKMWNEDLGALPVVDDKMRISSMITDRDICMAIGLNKNAGDKITVAQVKDSEVFSCTPNQDVRDAFELMKEKQVRRIPVVSESGKLTGMISLADIAASVNSSKRPSCGISGEEFVKTFAAIATPHLPQKLSQAQKQA